jgi:hypothetical protein
VNAAIKKRLKSLERSLAERLYSVEVAERLPPLSDEELQAVIDRGVTTVAPDPRLGSKARGAAERRFRMEDLATLTDAELLSVIYYASQR